MANVGNPPPRVSKSYARQIARDLYGIDVTVRSLPSYADKNFRLKCRDTGRKMVLKVANPATREDSLDLENRAMEHLGGCRGAFKVARVRPTSSGEAIAAVEDLAGSSCFVRLLSFVPGKMLADVDRGKPKLWRDLGRLLGELDRALEGFSHPAAHRFLSFDPKNGSALCTHLRIIRSRARRKLVERLLRRFRKDAEPLLPELRSSVIHNDGSIHNVLVRPNGTKRPRPSGIIDFGEMVHTATVCEPAVAVAYAILGKKDPMEVAKRVVRGYHELLPLTRFELRVILDLVCIRLCTSVIFSSYTRKLDPENEYLRLNERPAWAALEMLGTIRPREARRTLRRACEEKRQLAP